MRTTDELFSDRFAYQTFHDAVLEATGKDLSCMELHQFYIKLPARIRCVANEFGLADEGFLELVSNLK